jgi:hypothetical protein
MTTEHMVGHDIVALDEATINAVSQVGPADLTPRTPCADWTLSELLTHTRSSPCSAGVLPGPSDRWG